MESRTRWWRRTAALAGLLLAACTDQPAPGFELVARNYGSTGFFGSASDRPMSEFGAGGAVDPSVNAPFTCAATRSPQNPLGRNWVRWCDHADLAWRTDRLGGPLARSVGSPYRPFADVAEWWVR